MHDEIHVVVDSISAADETFLKDDPRCHIVRLILRHGDHEWIDGERPLAEMFEMVEKTGKLPMTSQPPIGMIIDMFTELVKSGKKVIMITVDSVLSGTYETCRLAARQVMADVEGADIRIIDSKTAACPISGIAMEVLEHTAAGMDIDAAEKMARDMVARTETFFSINTLDYLQKGGRIGAVGALIGSIFGIRPIVHLDKEGRLEVVDKCRTRKKVLKRIVELAAEKAPLEAIFVAHAEAAEDAEGLKAQMHELFPDVPIMLTGIGTVLAAHLGPGVIGIFVRQQAK